MLVPTAGLSVGVRSQFVHDEFSALHFVQGREEED